jgi:hypothetical protein
MPRLLLVVFIAATFLSPHAVRAEGGAEITPKLEEGRTLVYEVGFELERGLVLGAGRDRLVQQAGVRLTVESVDEDGVATVTGEFDWVVIDLDRAAFRVRVDSRDIVGDSPNLAETTIREMVGMYLDSTFALTVGPDGLVRDATGLEAIENKLAESRGSLPRLAAGRLTLETLKQDLEPVWRADGAAGKALADGDRWTTSRKSPLGAGVDLELTTAWTVEAVRDEGVEMVGDVTAEISLPEMEQEIPVTFEVSEQEGTSSGVWDRELGVMREREAFMSYTVTVSVRDEAQSSQRSGRSTLELVSVSSGE